MLHSFSMRSRFLFTAKSCKGNTRDVPFFNLHIVPLATGAADNKCVEDGEDSKSSSLVTFTPHDQLSHLQPEEIQLVNQTLSCNRVASACSCAFTEYNLFYGMYSGLNL